MTKLLILMLAMGLFFFGCGRQSEKTTLTEKNHPVGSDTTSQARAAVVPGSYEDWCEEHGVPESVDTRCNPSLIAAFKATNDWCAEHGVPESQCLRCNPDLKIVRPPRPEGI